MPTKITVRPNGPLMIEGEFEVVDAEGRHWTLEGKRSIFLCRCGQTKKSPFCDGTHKTCGFVSAPNAEQIPG